MSTFNLSKNNLHHAYILEGERGVLLPQLLQFIEKELGIALRGNPDLHQIITDTMGIDEARALSARASLRPSVDDKKIFIISVRDITDQAQNALLKLFEEPTVETHFFLIIPSVMSLLATLRSRMIHVTSSAGEQDVSARVRTFIKATPAKRLDTIADILKEGDKDESKGPLKEKALRFLGELEVELHRTLDRSNLTPEERLFFSELIQARQFLADQGSSVKMLLEHVAILLPRY